MERVGEESVFFVINDPLRDLTFMECLVCKSRDSCPKCVIHTNSIGTDLRAIFHKVLGTTKL